MMLDVRCSTLMVWMDNLMILVAIPCRDDF